MGVADRDYIRQPAGGGGFFDWSPGTAMVCKRLIAANIIVFLLQIFVTRPMTPADLRSHFGDRGAEQNKELEKDFESARWPRVSYVDEWCQLDTRKVLHGQVWRLVTSAFCHERMSVWHILFNMLFLWWFGKTLEMMYGSREFLLFYLSAAVIAGLCFMGLQLITGDRVPCIGASGAVMAVVMLYAIHYPRDRIWVFMLFPIEIRWVVVLYVIFDLHPVLLALAGTATGSGVAHAAHLGGLAFGFIYWKRSLRLEPLWDGLLKRRLPRWFGPRRSIRLFKPREAADEELDELVDKILIKVHEQGETSLTDVERELLRVAGQRYRRGR
jgi:membrane associated rhomboid family serine protease